jgi:hypothetical protein
MSPAVADSEIFAGDTKAGADGAANDTEGATFAFTVMLRQAEAPAAPRSSIATALSQ